jgi:hypothetical protein
LGLPWFTKTLPLFGSTEAVKKHLPGVPRLGLALPRLAVEVLRRSILNRSFFLGELGRFHERLIEEFFLSQDTTNRLVVGKLGELEKQGVEDGGLGLLVGLEAISLCEV